jgi:hypothetical protein
MSAKKSDDLTTEDAPDSILPWEMLDDAGIASASARLKGSLPELYLTAFARRVDTKVIACFDKGEDGKGKAILLIDEKAPPDRKVVKKFSGFGEWFDTAIADGKGRK